MRSAGSALQQLAADKLPLVFKPGGGFDFELGTDVHWLIRPSGSALQQLAADKLPLIFEPGGRFDLELGTDKLADPSLGVGQQQIGQHGLVELEALAFPQPFFPQYLLDLGLQLVEQDADAIPQPVVFTQQGIAIEDAGDARVALGEYQQQLQDMVAAGHGVFLFRHDEIDPWQQGILDKVDQPLEHPRLAGKMSIEGGLRDTDLCCQASRGDTLTRTGFQHVGERLQDLVAPTLFLITACHGFP